MIGFNQNPLFNEDQPQMESDYEIQLHSEFAALSPDRSKHSCRASGSINAGCLVVIRDNQEVFAVSKVEQRKREILFMINGQAQANESTMAGARS